MVCPVCFRELSWWERLPWITRSATAVHPATAPCQRPPRAAYSSTPPSTVRNTKCGAFPSPWEPPGSSTSATADQGNTCFLRGNDHPLKVFAKSENTIHSLSPTWTFYNMVHEPLGNINLVFLYLRNVVLIYAFPCT